jgi:hypothetical protein
MENLIKEIVFKPEDHTYWFWDVRVPSVSEILKYCRMYSDNTYIPEHYRTRGTILHAITEYMDGGGSGYDVVPPEYAAFVSAYEQWHSDCNVEILESETMLFNSNFLYCGTEDRFAIIDDKKTVIDIKLGYYQKWHKLQTCFYSEARGFGYYVENNLSKTIQTANLYLKKEGIYDYKDTTESIYSSLKYVEAACNTYWYHRERDAKKLRKYIKEVVK